jgi:general secretion pathway protein L
MVLGARGTTLSDATVVRVPLAAGQGSAGEAGTVLSFLRIAGGKVVQQGRARLADLPRSRNTVLVFAAEDVLVLERTVPPLNERRLRAALPALVEDATFADLSSIHVASSEDRSGQRLLAVIDRSLLTLWLERFEEDARIVTQAWCEQLAMPHQRGQVSIAARSEERGAVLRIGQDSVLSIAATPAAEGVVMHALAQHPEVTEAVVFGDKIESAFFEALLARQNLPVRRGGRDALAEYIESGEAGDRIDLLQGEFARGLSLSGVRAWRAAAVLIALALVIETGGLLIRSSQLEHDKAHLIADQSAILKGAFPQTTTVLDAPMQMRRALDALQAHAGQSGQQDFEALLTHAGTLLSSLPPNVCSEMHFDDGVLSMHLKAPMLASSQAQSLVIKAAQSLGNTATFTASGSDGDLTLRLSARSTP